MTTADLATAWHKTLTSAWWHGLIYGSEKLWDCKGEQNRKGIDSYDQRLTSKWSEVIKDVHERYINLTIINLFSSHLRIEGKFEAIQHSINVLVVVVFISSVTMVGGILTWGSWN